MAAKEKRRIYLKTGHARFAPIAWFAESTRHELLVGFRGLASTTPIHAGRLPDREATTDDLRRGIDRSYADIEPVGVAADHFTYHRDGTCHLKLGPGADARYSDSVFSPPIDQTTQRFLDMVTLGDRADRYPVERPKRPYLSVAIEPDLYVTFRVWVSGSEYDLGKIVERETKQSDGVSAFILSSFKVAVEVCGLQLPEEVAASRPPGTFVEFRWLIGHDRHLLRGFVFA